ncbi:hypothetical protein BJF93_05070 [Xaviernesmea oryzae]|uniref:Transmembrane protein n=1 Tax=Xaviernesmea oryzae TaxID=464029 RepID=A0A1Q9AUY2_9HYPH|nr:hypothetical protein [Xaviernesmea oryzae]OLP59261.1 hypothetical protein BJF93_05070 [Xaviernesmea oryzae]SEK79091.1 hypothetical protein SAMN04487976_10429 [Xaviernesmea oryzae]
MPQLEDVGIYLKGLWLLILGKREGFDWLDISVPGVWRSFGAIPWCLPAMTVSWASWRLAYLAAMPAGTPTGLAFIAKLLLVDLASWILPLLLVVALSRPLGYDMLLAPLIVTTNWLSVPTYYAMAVPSALRLVLPNADGFTALLSILALICALLALFRILRAITGEQVLLAWALSALFVLPSLMLGETLQRTLGLIPG